MMCLCFLLFIFIFLFFSLFMEQKFEMFEKKLKLRKFYFILIVAVRTYGLNEISSIKIKANILNKIH